MIAQHCPLLEDLKVSGQCIERVVIGLSKHSKELKQVQVDNSNLNEDCLVTLVRNAPGLQSFSTNTRSVHTAFLEELKLSCHRLTKICRQSFR
jgi:hypothetical protein